MSDPSAVVGWFAAFIGAVGFGSFAVPIKGEAANSVDIDPLVRSQNALRPDDTIVSRRSSQIQISGDAILQEHDVLPDELVGNPARSGGDLHALGDNQRPLCELQMVCLAFGFLTDLEYAVGPWRRV